MPSGHDTPVAQSISTLSTPAITEADTATETELETEVELELNEKNALPNAKAAHFANRMKALKISRHQPNLSMDSTLSSNGDAESSNTHASTSSPRTLDTVVPKRRKVLSQHDLLNKYFRRDAVVLRNVDLLRLVDFHSLFLLFL